MSLYRLENGKMVSDDEKIAELNREIKALRKAGARVITHWEKGDLAYAVRCLNVALGYADKSSLKLP